MKGKGKGKVHLYCIVPLQHSPVIHLKPLSLPPVLLTVLVINGYCTSTGSGVRMTLLVQRRILKQLQFIKVEERGNVRGGLASRHLLEVIWVGF